MPQLKEFFRRADMLLLIVSLISALYGLAVIWSATLWTDNGPAQYVIVQTLGIVIGIAAFAVITVIDLDIFSAHWKWLYALSAGLGYKF